MQSGTSAFKSSSDLDEMARFPQTDLERVPRKSAERYNLHVCPDSVVRNPSVGGKESDAIITFRRVLLPKAPVGEESGRPPYAARIRSVIRNVPKSGEHRLDGQIGFVRQFAGHEFSLERQRQSIAGCARPKRVMKAVAHAVELVAEAACRRSWEGESVSRAGSPISLSAEQLSLFLREPLSLAKTSSRLKTLGF